MSLMVKQGDRVQLWYVTGIPTTYFVTKMEAEKAARAMFPDEAENKRYARISYLQSEPFQDIG